MSYKFWLHTAGTLVVIVGLMLSPPANVFAQAKATDPAVAAAADTASHHVCLPVGQADSAAYANAADNPTGPPPAGCTPVMLIYSLSGYEWIVADSTCGPQGSSNYAYSSNNVWKDAIGDLHLKIGFVNGQWSCAEVYSMQAFGFGQFQWQIKGPIDTLDPNVMLALDLHAPDEIAIRFSRWGVSTNPAGNYSVATYRYSAPIPSPSRY